MSSIDFWSPIDPVPGLDDGSMHRWGTVEAHRRFGLDFVLKSSYRHTSAPRMIHGMTVREGNRLGSDVELRIHGKEIGLILGMASVYAPLSPIADLEQTRFGRLGLQVGSLSFYFSNDFFGLGPSGFVGTDQSYTGELGIEHRRKHRLSSGIIVTGARLRILGTTGIPQRSGGTVMKGGRNYYQYVKYEEANAGAAVLGVSALVNRTPVEFSLTIIDDRIRQIGQGAIHRAAGIHEFSPSSKARSGFFLQFTSDF